MIGMFFGLCFLFVCAVGAAGLYVYSQLQPVEAKGEQEKLVTIPSGSSVRQIGNILEQQGLIKNGRLFGYYVQYKGWGEQLQAGDYRFVPGATIDELVKSMRDGEVIVNTVHFTIPEGWNVDQIAASLAEKSLVDKQTFLKEVQEGNFPEYPFVADIPKNKDRKYRLEGYLFPETYEMEKGATEHEIIAKMLGQFQKEIKPEWLEALKQRNMKLDDAVNLASIVEREVTVDKERPIVAGVYFNRLHADWMLQADATVQFILGKQRDRITFDDLKIKNPYNTYVNKGLPPGPIANPGRASLAAVVSPQKHDYFFYVTKKDGSSEHFFSKTLEEHVAKDAKSRGK